MEGCSLWGLEVLGRCLCFEGCAERLPRGQPRIHEGDGAPRGRLESPLELQKQYRQRTTVLAERVNIKLLIAYVQRRVDAKQAYLDKTIERYLKEGHAVGDPAKGMWETSVAYWCKDGYGRLLAVGFSMQKCIKQSRSFAFRMHAVDVDQEDSYNRHTLNALEDEEVFDDDTFAVLPLRVQHRENWLGFTVEYSRVGRDEVKQGYQALTFGARPTADLPPIRKLAQEYMHAADRLVNLPKNAWLSHYYGDRRQPLLSRDNALLNFRETSSLLGTSTELDEQASSEPLCYVYDGGAFSCYGPQQRALIEDVLHETSGKQNVRNRIKPWELDDQHSVAVRLFEKGVCARGRQEAGSIGWGSAMWLRRSAILLTKQIRNTAKSGNHAIPAKIRPHSSCLKLLATSKGQAFIGLSRIEL